MTYEEATDFIFGVFKAAWGVRPAVYDDVAGAAPVTDEVWARATIQHVNGQAGSLADETGRLRWNRTGFVTVQVFAPVGDATGAGLQAAQLVTNAYQATRGRGVWFRNVTMREAGRDGSFRQYNVTASFTYDDVR